jgi:signal transduction histidine kinase
VLVPSKSKTSEQSNSSDSLVRRLTRRFIEETENERMRIARELHDDIGQRLSLVATRLRTLEQGKVQGDEVGSDEVRESLRELDALISDVHHLSHSLHSSMLEHLGLAAALKELCFKVSGLHSVRVDFVSNEMRVEISQSAALCLYRVAQEALNNVVKHSGASQARVSLMGGDKVLKMEVRDFGAGFERAEAPIGLGFTTMEGRLLEVDGKFTVHSQRGKGTLIRAEIPLSRRAPASRNGAQEGAA